MLPKVRLFYEDFDNVGGPTAGGAGTYSFPPAGYCAMWIIFLPIRLLVISTKPGKEEGIFHLMWVILSPLVHPGILRQELPMTDVDPIDRAYNI